MKRSHVRKFRVEIPGYGDLMQVSHSQWSPSQSKPGNSTWAMVQSPSLDDWSMRIEFERLYILTHCSVDQSSWTIDPRLWWKTIDPLFFMDQSSFHVVDQQSTWINSLVFPEGTLHQISIVDNCLMATRLNVRISFHFLFYIVAIMWISREIIFSEDEESPTIESEMDVFAKGAGMDSSSTNFI